MFHAKAQRVSRKGRKGAAKRNENRSQNLRSKLNNIHIPVVSYLHTAHLSFFTFAYLLICTSAHYSVLRLLTGLANAALID